MSSQIQVQETAERLHSAAIRLLRRLRKTDAGSGLTGPQASALSVLVFGGEMTLSGLAAAEQVRPPTMSRLIKEMEAAGLVQRRRDPADARGVRLSATRKGREGLALGRTRRLRRLTAALNARSDKERQVLAEAAALLAAIAEAPELD